jgi:kynureninase
MESIASLIEREGDSIALILIGGVNYYSGQLYDMREITRLGQSKGITVGFDLAHAIGNVPLELHERNVDFATWCTCKYLNAGPRCIAGCFIHEKYAEKTDLCRFEGWWGHDKKTRFLMGSEFEPIYGAEGWQLSNPPILPLASLRASMKIFDEVGIDKLRKKSILLTGYLEFLIDELDDERVSIITPRSIKNRGAQLSIKTHRNGKNLFNRLTSNGIVCDWREPDVIRVAPVPLYNSFADVYKFTEILKKCIS